MNNKIRRYKIPFKGLRLSIALMFLSCFLLNGQSNSVDLSIKKFGKEEGLYLSSFHSILRDSADMLWILGLKEHPISGESELGFYSYDGERFIKNHLPKPPGVENHPSYEIFPWSNGKILFNASFQNLWFIYDPYDRTFNEIGSKKKDFSSVSIGKVFKTKFYGIGRSNDGNFVLVVVEDESSDTLFSSDLLKDALGIYPDDDGIWICRPQEVLYFNFNGQIRYRINIGNENKELYTHANTVRGIEIFFPDADPIIIERASGEIKPFPLREVYNKGKIFKIEVDNHGNAIYVFTDPYLLDRIYLVNTIGEIFDLSEIKLEVTGINTIIGEDFSQSIWITSTTDIVEVKLQNTYVSQYLINAELRKIALFNDQLYVATESGGIYKSPNKLHLDFSFLSSEKNPRLLEITPEGYMLTNDLGLFYKKKGDDIAIFDSRSTVFDAISLNDTLIAIGSREGIFFAGKEEWKVRHYDKDSFNFIHKLLRINDSEFLIASMDGISRMDVAKNITTNLYGDDSVLSITEDTLGQWWFGTISGQLNKLSIGPSGVSITSLTNVGSTIATITKDDRERLWLGTFNGIYVFDEDAHLLFKIDDNLISHSECNRLSSYFHAENRQMMIGTVHGLNVFDLNNIEFDESKSRLALSFLQYFNPAINQNDTIFLNGADQSKVKLNAYHRYLDVAFGPGISSGKNHEYFYTLMPGSKLGSEPESWINNGKNAHVSLSNISSGRYTLFIKSQNKSTGLESNVLAVDIKVGAYFYNQWWFYALIFLVVALFFFFWRERLRKENIRLEKEVEKRTSELKKDKEIIQKQAEELSILDRAKSTFYNNISHELKTPLTLISGPLESIKEGEYIKDVRGNQLINLIEKNVNHLTGRVEELLEINRLENNKVGVNNTPLILSKFVEDHVEIFSELAAQKHIEFGIACGNPSELIIIDEKKLGKVVQNLISNALKYCPAGSRIDVEFYIIDNTLQIHVADNGNGIPGAYQHLVFDKFYQLPTNESSASGSGIGLSIVKEYVTLMGGEVKLKSEEGKGTRFELYIPINVIEDVEVTKDAETIVPIIELPKFKHHHLLIVEDNADLRTFLTVILSDYFLITTAPNGIKALEILNDKPNIDIILSDIMMPDMDGMELLAKIKAEEKLKKLPFIFLTAKQNEVSKFSALRLGVDDYLTKPFSKNELLLRMARLLKNAEIRNAPIAAFETSDEIEDDGLYEKLEKFVISSLSDPTFNVESIAEEMGMSERNLRRYLQKEIGMTPKDFITEVKMNWLRELRFKDKDISLKALASLVGYTDHKYMSKLFFERFGYRLM